MYRSLHWLIVCVTVGFHFFLHFRVKMTHQLT